MLPNDYQPSFFIYFDIPPESIDVNIHPTKTEIKFADEQTVFQILMAAVREALGKFSLSPTIDFDTRGSIDIPMPQNHSVSRPQVTVDPDYNPFHTRGAVYPDKAPKGWESLYGGEETRNDVISAFIDSYRDRSWASVRKDRYGSTAASISLCRRSTVCCSSISIARMRSYYARYTWSSWSTRRARCSSCSSPKC